jgi:hypothetical protein
VQTSGGNSRSSSQVNSIGRSFSGLWYRPVPRPSYEAQPVIASGGDLDEKIVQRYAELVGHPDPWRFLVARGLAQEIT